MPSQTEIKILKKSKLLDGLNAEQEKAVTHKDGPLLIVAGAGTGKTTVITRRIAYLIEQGAKPDEILALAFGEKAAGEMEERVDMLVPTGYVNMQISTFHAFGEQILREYGIEIGLPDFKVLNEVGQWLLVRNNLDKFDLDYYRPLGNPTKFIKAMLSHFSRLKDELITPEEYLDYAEKLELDTGGAETRTEDDVPGEPKRLREIAGAYHVYNKMLVENSALDFGDLINYTLQLLKKRPKILARLQRRYKYILVDEFQDTNLAQYELLKLLAAPDNNITVVGDDDQSIFKFRGASISNILHFQKDYPEGKFISLTDNYRSGQKILDSAYDFIQANNPDRLEIKLKLSKKLKSQTTSPGQILHLEASDYLLEANLVVNKIAELQREYPALTLNDFAILARSHGTLEPFLTKLEEEGVPFIYFANKGLYNKTIILDILAYFKLLDNYHESPALYRVLKLPIFRISHDAIVEYASYAKRKSLSLFEALKIAAPTIDDDSKTGIRLFFEILRKHSELVKTKTADQIYVAAINDLKFTNRIDTATHEGMQNARYLETFRRRIQDFQNESPDKSTRTFLTTLLLEQEAGEEGDVEFDPESGPEAVKLLTVHAAKGLEFTHVFVVGMVDKRFPTIERREQIEIPVELIKEFLPEGDFHIEEERRLFYVAMTRAKLGLYLTSAEDYGGKRKKRPSLFLHDLGLVEKTKAAKATGQVAIVKRIKFEPFKLPLPKYFSFSQISLFEKCPLEYKYRYIMRLPVAGSGVQSFGITIHTVLEKYLNLYKQTINSPDLFGSPAKPELPAFETLRSIYEKSWIDDWYDSRQQMEEYKKVGMRIITDFYAECQANNPKPKYLEKAFKLKLGNYYFTGKIDRVDETDLGLRIIDYKTGASRNIEKVDKKQLLSYQWAATEAFGEKVADLQYWYLKDKLEKKSFLGGAKDIEELKQDFLEWVEKIVDCTRSNAFLKYDQQASHKTKCKYLELEL
ncbi:MAG: hypothetical protein A3C85_04280 [Candidatus Doudnabacteria bacterium RIFCSPHIGHO2_02_FULL_48_21]|uniref:DNA 3'-5' helicase n=1 Tax=Candidatus Doudnabacteria bacterium RIFCSPLOWO2_02_FULL_48_13 TaxID=1817845 RepID=A0A1F5QAE9_9BACT|nr:MAG: hypothetical protein A3K05_00965 [Candidatus Doudnabacteria bacterium RIFCSPHIGHO2_01_48_18]OGE78879.1 MAG: hypothetical protein A2668_00680 [Candidatus Doudnabacteria bacterium RIFCSPHIGHO2_01_FULL_48_180]OGE91870.1 MAG: hypothetical protein A3F44_04360 [Candidatus Doudnabacteria bacterium RIFCSPHIGHO2_12_FULL_47_25]OGE94107.1 MAG: hypothetical protein A3C85_04280 [Candidatus Doudnabacteria bacterium RIFCSPHIGHO2_02_FULL_48_21]OGE98187.1 MAG: hypothetical protein A3A83_03395 [Candidatu